MAEKDDNKENEFNTTCHKMEIWVEGILYAPTEQCRINEIQSLAETIGNSAEKYELFMAALNKIKENYIQAESSTKPIDDLIEQVDSIVDPIKIYSEMLDSDDVYHISYACRCLADHNAIEYKDKIKELSENEDPNLAYNASMALAHFGDTQSVANYIHRIENNKTISFRLVNEFFENFTGDRAELAEMLFKNSNKYMRNTIIKSIAQYKIERFIPMYLEGASGDDLEFKNSCIVALGFFGLPEYEQLFQIAAQDQYWVLRVSAIKGLAKIGTHTALETVKNALNDKEWWVRNTAADAMLSMDISAKDIEDILGGYDRFASDAIKNLLYRKIDMKSD